MSAAPALSPHRYRADIDGLRALAVLLVLAYHAYPLRFPGGFAGVDVFFVISGFLIASQTLSEMKAGCFSPTLFYARRIRRIFPALLLVLACTLVLGWIYLLPEELRVLGNHGVAAGTFWPNIFSWQDEGYTGGGSVRKPLLHLWSLGVEEQFYFLWPWILLAGSRIRGGVPGAILLLSAWSFRYFLTRVGIRTGPEFCLSTFRAWELGLGCALGWLALRGLASPRGALLSNGLSLAGAILVGAGILSVHGVPEDSAAALIPVTLGSGLIVLAGQGALLNRLVLGSRPAAALGRISYPLYLWHWPLLAFVKIVEGGKATAHGSDIAIALAFPFAALSARFVERPLRSRPERVAVPLLAAMGLFLALSGLAGRGLVPPLSSRYGLGGVLEPRKFPKLDSVGHVQVGRAVFEHASAQPETVLLIGDSDAYQYWSRITKLVRENPRTSRSAILAFFPSCAPIPNPGIAVESGCLEFQQSAYELAANADVKTVVLAALWIKALDEFLELGSARMIRPGQEAALARAREAFTKVIRDFRRQGKRVVVVLNIPVAFEFDLEGIVKRKWWGRWDLNLGGITRASWDATSGREMAWLSGVARAAGAEVIDPVPYLCDHSTCPSLDRDGHRIYTDSAHLSSEYVASQVTFLDELFLGTAAGSGSEPKARP